jgi:cellulose synthase/poly-beta-1,6-N-acetylglucosamine synthase-like glycosyltransferase
VPKLTIVIPAYNEARTIHRILDRVAQVELPDGLGKEVIVVNDCSRDTTQQVLEAYRDGHPELPMTVIRHDVNQGKGAALHTGIRKATGEYLIIQDADWSTIPAERAVAPSDPRLCGRQHGAASGGKPHRILFFWHTIATGCSRS